MNIGERNEVVENLLTESLRGWNDVSFVHSAFTTHRCTSSRSLAEVQQLTIGFIEEFVRRGWIVLGVPMGRRNPKFETWDVPLDTALRAIKRAYVDHFDNFDGWREAWWFDLTEEGQKVAKALDQAELTDEERDALLAED